MQPAMPVSYVYPMDKPREFPPNSLAARIQERLEATGLSARAASNAADLGDSFVKNIFSGASKNPRIDTLARLARVLGTTSDWLVSGGDQQTGTDSVLTTGRPVGGRAMYIAEPNAGTVVPTVRGPDRPVLPRVQELGIGVASIDEDDSAFYLNGQTIDHVPRPPGLANRQDVFALRVANLSMWPKFRDGERIYVDTKRPAIEDFVVVELYPAVEGDPGKAYVKMLVARDGRKLTVEQFNPPGRLEFRNQEIKRTYRVIPNEELWG